MSTIYHDATLGNAVNIALVRLIFMEKKEVGFQCVYKVKHNVTDTLYVCSIVLVHEVLMLSNDNRTVYCVNRLLNYIIAVPS